MHAYDLTLKLKLIKDIHASMDVLACGGVLQSLKKTRFIYLLYQGS